MKLPSQASLQWHLYTSQPSVDGINEKAVGSGRIKMCNFRKGLALVYNPHHGTMEST